MQLAESCPRTPQTARPKPARASMAGVWPMEVLILTLGTLGDIQPFIALG